MNIEEFRRVGEWFKQLPETAKVNMSATDRKERNCKSPACFGGWLATYYKCPPVRERIFFAGGLRAFTEALQIKDYSSLNLWANANPQFWGNGYGLFLHANAIAFDEGGREYTNSNITTKAIGEKLLAVYGRLKKVY